MVFFNDDVRRYVYEAVKPHHRLLLGLDDRPRLLENDPSPAEAAVESLRGATDPHEPATSTDSHGALSDASPTESAAAASTETMERERESPVAGEKESASAGSEEL